jgi:hypothetical protein
VPSFKIGDVDITCEDNVKHLGVDIDFMLNFDNHIKTICKKAVQQLNILKRIGRNLCKLSRLFFIHLYCPCLLIKSDKTGGARSCNILNVSSAMALVLLTACKD